jgi:hypothetical protein
MSRAGEVKTISMNDYISQPYVYWYPPSDWTTEDTGNWSTTPEGDGVGAWRIYETMANDFYNRGAYYFLKYDSRGPHYDMPVVTAIYPSPGGGGLSWYNPVLRQLMIASDEATKALDSVQHEYGHRVFAECDGLIPGAINHHFWDIIGSALAWSEGWADFFPLLIQDNPYYDYGNGGNYNLNDPPTDWNTGDGVEARIAGALWDFYDNTTNFGYDQYSCGFMPIWNAVNPMPLTLASFWGIFQQGKLPQDILDSARALHQNTIDYPELQFYLFTYTFPSSAGSIDRNPSSLSYSLNQSVNLNASASTGCNFSNWSGDLTGITNPDNISMNSDKTVTGVFTQSPSVTTTAATSITSTSATLSGNLTSNGTAGTVNVSFEWGLTTIYGNTTTAQSTTGTFSDGITGLSPNTTYHFRAKAIGDGTSFGNDQQFTTNSPLSITTTSLNTGERTLNYDPQTLSASGGSGSGYAWSLAGGNLPNGLSLSSGGTISGTPTAAGTSNFTVRVTDSNSNTTTKPLSIIIIDRTNITTTSLSGGTVRTFYDQSLSVSGGISPYTWSIDSGTLPSGLSLNVSNGRISGIPTTAGAPNIAFRVTDSLGVYHTKYLSITIIYVDPTVSTVRGYCTPNSAKLYGDLTSLGSAGSVAVSFQYGLDTNYGNVAPVISSPMSTTGTFYADISGLTAQTIYHYRARAVMEGHDPIYGLDGYFKACLPGDADLNGVINMGDVIRVERIILELIPEVAEADANIDHDIDMGDVTWIERILLYAQKSGAPPKTEKMAGDAVSVSLNGPAQVDSGSDFTVGVDVSQLTDFDSSNFDISFNPNVIRLDNVTDGLIDSASIPIDDYAEMSSGTYRVLINVPGASGVSGSGTLATLHFHVIGSYGQTSSLTFSNGVAYNYLAEQFETEWTGGSVAINIPTFTVNASVSGGHGTVNPATQTINYGSNASITLAPDSGYHIASITDNGVSKPIANPYVISNVIAAHTVVATFSNTYTITASAGAGGTISPSCAVTVTAGTNQTFTISPGSGYIVSDVLVDSVSQGRIDSYTFSSVNADHAISVSFDGGWYAPSAYSSSTFTNPSNVYTSNNLYASASVANKSVIYSNCTIPAIPSGSVIDGIQVALEGYRGGTLNTLDVYLSWNGGSSYTALKNSGDIGTVQDKTIILGGPTDTWGRTWSYSQFTNTNFRVKVKLHAGGYVYLDCVKVKVSYH